MEGSSQIHSKQETVSRSFVGCLLSLRLCIKKLVCCHSHSPCCSHYLPDLQGDAYLGCSLRRARVCGGREQMRVGSWLFVLFTVSKQRVERKETCTQNPGSLLMAYILPGKSPTPKVLKPSQMMPPMGLCSDFTFTATESREDAEEDG